MPELPDVETFRRYFDRTALHQKIRQVEVPSPRILELSVEELERALVGRHFLSSRRHGKVLFAQTDADLWLSVHFGMSGFFRYFEDPAQRPSHVRCLFIFDNGRKLAYDNQRMIGRIGVVRTPEEYIKRHDLGPDALAVDLESFRERLGKKTGKLKQTLMEQELVAGIGNEYADEILFQMQIHPETRVAALDEALWRKLHAVTVQVLSTAVESGADAQKMPDSFLLPHRGRKGTCPRCSTPFKQLKVGGRTTYYCPHCQPAP